MSCLIRVLTILLLWLAPLTVAHAEATFGGVFLASRGKGFPCEKAIWFYQRIPDRVYHATLFGSFGRNTRCDRRVLALPQQVTFETHAINPFCDKDDCVTRDIIDRIQHAEFGRLVEAEHPRIERAAQSRFARILAWCQSQKKIYRSLSTESLLGVPTQQARSSDARTVGTRSGVAV